MRIAAIRRDCRPEARALTESSIAALPVVASEPLVLLHGDPWSGNVVWGAAGPVLVDWEYARLGERAEDLAYLAALDALAPATSRGRARRIRRAARPCATASTHGGR